MRTLTRLTAATYYIQHRSATLDARSFLIAERRDIGRRRPFHLAKEFIDLPASARAFKAVRLLS